MKDSDTIDNFSNKQQVQAYENSRPRYPKEMMIDLVKEHKKSIINNNSNNRNIVYDSNNILLDVATGTGQIASKLTNDFQTVIATDISNKQLSVPINKYKDIKNLHFIEGNAHDLELVLKESIKLNIIKNNTTKVDVITLGQCFHWFNKDKFFLSANKVLKSTGIIAICGYNFIRVMNPGFNEASLKFYKTVRPYFDFDRGILENEYKDIEFPKQYCINRYNYIQKLQVSSDLMYNYCLSSSAYHCYMKKYFGEDYISRSSKNDKINSHQDTSITDPLKELENYISEYKKTNSDVIDIEIDYFMIILNKKI